MNSHRGHNNYLLSQCHFEDNRMILCNENKHSKCYDNFSKDVYPWFSSIDIKRTRYRMNFLNQYVYTDSTSPMSSTLIIFFRYS